MHRSPMMFRLAVIALAASLAGPVACGQRGPLYLPEEAAPQAPADEQGANENDSDAATT